MASVIDNSLLRLSAIEGVDCIGDSRVLINSNFTVLGSALSSTMGGVFGFANFKNVGNPTALTTVVKALSVFTPAGAYIGFIPIYQS